MKNEEKSEKMISFIITTEFKRQSEGTCVPSLLLSQALLSFIFLIEVYVQ